MKSPSLAYLLRVFLFLGATAFGGYTALVSMIKKKLVDEDALLEEQTVFDGITIASILPGPLAVNVVTYIGYHLRGWMGAVISFLAIIFPSFVLVTGLAWLYYTFNYIPAVSSFLEGVYPVIAAIIMGVAWNFAWKHLSSLWQYLTCGGVFLLLFFARGYWVLVGCLALGAVAGLIFHKEEGQEAEQPKDRRDGSLIIGLAIIMVGFFVLYALLGTSNRQLFQSFAQVSLTLFGGGYVMIPMLEALVVDQHAWLSSEEFYNAIAFGQITPGPILISAAYVGYAHTGVVGAGISTLAIFLPSALLMVVMGAFYQAVAGVKEVSKAIVGIRPVVIALILFSVFLVMRTTPMDVFTFASFAISFTLISRFGVPFWMPMLASGVINVAIGYL